jgi:hypothetical protein
LTCFGNFDILTRMFYLYSFLHCLPHRLMDEIFYD